mmetsp:Transcript_4127/g.15410  ORF Transcript_4127/g.15410 Transcript_4127/m.15410 type:complete len:282 (+) Transcript_4127:147-992(+)
MYKHRPATRGARGRGEADATEVSRQRRSIVARHVRPPVALLGRLCGALPHAPLGRRWCRRGRRSRRRAFGAGRRPRGHRRAPGGHRVFGGNSKRLADGPRCVLLVGPDLVHVLHHVGGLRRSPGSHGGRDLWALPHTRGCRRRNARSLCVQRPRVANQCMWHLHHQNFGRNGYHRRIRNLQCAVHHRCLPVGCAEGSSGHLQEVFPPGCSFLGHLDPSFVVGAARRGPSPGLRVVRHVRRLRSFRLQERDLARARGDHWFAGGGAPLRARERGLGSPGGGR